MQTICKQRRLAAHPHDDIDARQARALGRRRQAGDRHLVGREIDAVRRRSRRRNDGDGRYWCRNRTGRAPPRPRAAARHRGTGSVRCRRWPATPACASPCTSACRLSAVTWRWPPSNSSARQSHPLAGRAQARRAQAGGEIGAGTGHCADAICKRARKAAWKGPSGPDSPVCAMASGVPYSAADPCSDGRGTVKR
mgnify:CR=1 FL=1